LDKVEFLRAYIISLSTPRIGILKKGARWHSWFFSISYESRQRYWLNSRMVDPREGNGSWHVATPESNQT